MNELTKEASKQAILERFASLWRGGRGRVRKSRQQPENAPKRKYDALRSAYCLHEPLKGEFNDYLTGLEPSGETLEDIDWRHMPFKWRGIDLDKFKRECEEVDNE